MSRSIALGVVGVCLLLGGLAFWGSGSGAAFFGESETIPLVLGYTAAGIAACAVIASEMTKVRS